MYLVLSLLGALNSAFNTYVGLKENGTNDTKSLYDQIMEKNFSPNFKKLVSNQLVHFVRNSSKNLLDQTDILDTIDCLEQKIISLQELFILRILMTLNPNEITKMDLFDKFMNEIILNCQIEIQDIFKTETFLIDVKLLRKRLCDNLHQFLFCNSQPLNYEQGVYNEIIFNFSNTIIHICKKKVELQKQFKHNIDEFRSFSLLLDHYIIDLILNLKVSLANLRSELMLLF